MSIWKIVIKSPDKQTCCLSSTFTVTPTVLQLRTLSRQSGWLAGWLASRKYNYKTMSVRSVACGSLYQNLIVCNCYVSLVQCASSFISFIRNCVIDTVIKAAAGTYIQFSFRKNSVIDQKDEIKKVIEVAYKSFNINPFNLFLKGHKTMFLNLSYFPSIHS